MESTRANFLNARGLSANILCLLLPCLQLLWWDFALPELMTVMGQSGLATDFVTYIKSDLAYPDLDAVSSVLLP